MGDSTHESSASHFGNDKSGSHIGFGIKLTDGGLHWSEPKSTGLASPESCPELTRIPMTGDLLLGWNNTFEPEFRSHYGERSSLTLAVSKDPGHTWQHMRDIESGPKRVLSNPGVHFIRDGLAIRNY